GVDTDPDGDGLTVVAANIPTAGGGSVVLNEDGSFTYTPAENFYGTDSFTYEVTDGTYTDTAIVTLNVVPASSSEAPIAEDDTFEGNRDIVINGNVLDNDSDPDGDAIAVVSGTYATDHGSITISVDGTFSYTPDTGYIGGDSFIYTLEDATGETDTATISFTLNQVDYIYGTPGNDALYGGDGADELFGGDGKDRLYGNDGDDILHGESGNDRLYGGDGDDELFGGDGRDRLYGGNGDDELFGGDDKDWLYGNDGDDILHGESGNDRLFGGNGADELYGGDGRDHLYGGDGDDILHGESGNDHLFGGNGDDELYGGDGRDHLYGGDGDDILVGGAGNDILVGDTSGVSADVGADTFKFITMDGSVDTIEDFSVNEGDMIDISNVLSDYDPLTDVITDFVQITEDGFNSYLSVDANGGADNFVTIAILTSVTGIEDVQDLIDADNMIV
ncbi:MAG: tandem-95 repeat protein, partial [Alphaproteobacteria bacterium]|nr:tandem-95 repeat protein [Alphaproteobacteria bacterium]